jgi:pyrroloquinoline quinone biosynthesis protein B
LRSQIEAFPPLQPDPAIMRGSPVEGVLLTNADLDHVLGLILLREGAMLSVHATPAMRESLVHGLNLQSLLEVFCGIQWLEPPRVLKPLFTRAGQPGGLLYRAIPLPGDPPRFASNMPDREGHSVAYQIVDERTGGKLLIAPDVGFITDDLLTALQDSDAILFDGTFGSEDELRHVQTSFRTASEMGHLPIGSGSIKCLHALPARHKIYIHINNTNPILRPDTPERAEVEAAGITVSFDGLELDL